MSETFAELFEQSLNDIDMTPGAIVDAMVVAIEPDFVIVNAGLKSEGAIPRTQFLNESGGLAVVIGDSVKVALDAVEDGFGATRLSREKAKRAEAWIDLEKAREQAAKSGGENTAQSMEMHTRIATLAKFDDAVRTYINCPHLLLCSRFMNFMVNLVAVLRASAN